MTKEFYNKMLLMSSLCLLSFSGPVSAQCVTPPTCSELGYTKSAADCEGHTFLKCPFDQNVGYCDEGAAINGIDPDQKYTIGSSFVINGIPVGIIVYLDSSKKHGSIAIPKGQANAADATTICNNLTAGGLNWGLASAESACRVLGHIEGNDCQVRTSTGNGYCLLNELKNYTSYACNKPDKESIAMGFACEAAF